MQQRTQAIGWITSLFTRYGQVCTTQFDRHMFTQKIPSLNHISDDIHYYTKMFFGPFANNPPTSQSDHGSFFMVAKSSSSAAGQSGISVLQKVAVEPGFLIVFGHSSWNKLPNTLFNMILNPAIRSVTSLAGVALNI